MKLTCRGKQRSEEPGGEKNLLGGFRVGKEEGG